MGIWALGISSTQWSSEWSSLKLKVHIASGIAPKPDRQCIDSFNTVRTHTKSFDGQLLKQPRYQQRLSPFFMAGSGGMRLQHTDG